MLPAIEMKGDTNKISEPNLTTGCSTRSKPTVRKWESEDLPSHPLPNADSCRKHATTISKSDDSLNFLLIFLNRVVIDTIVKFNVNYAAQN